MNIFGLLEIPDRFPMFHRQFISFTPQLVGGSFQTFYLHGVTLLV